MSLNASRTADACVSRFPAPLHSTKWSACGRPFHRRPPDRASLPESAGFGRALDPAFSRFHVPIHSRRGLPADRSPASPSRSRRAPPPRKPRGYSVDGRAGHGLKDRVCVIRRLAGENTVCPLAALLSHRRKDRRSSPFCKGSFAEDSVQREPLFSGPGGLPIRRRIASRPTRVGEHLLTKASICRSCDAPYHEDCACPAYWSNSSHSRS